MQLWTTRFGKGRVAAFTDSTSFSNFCVFEPGKKELWMGMLDWLNHSNPWIDPRYPLLLAGLVLAALAFGGRGDGAGVAGTGGLRGAGLGVGGLGRPLCPCRGDAAVAAVGVRVRPVEVVMDQTVCSKPLPTDGTVDVRGRQLRHLRALGPAARVLHRPARRARRVPRRRTGLPASRLADEPAEFVDRVAQYVDDGGKVVVVEAPNEAKKLGQQDIADELRGRNATPPGKSPSNSLAAKTGPQANVLLVGSDWRSTTTRISVASWPVPRIGRRCPVTDAYAVVSGGQALRLGQRHSPWAPRSPWANAAAP